MSNSIVTLRNGTKVDIDSPEFRAQIKFQAEAATSVLWMTHMSVLFSNGHRLHAYHAQWDCLDRVAAYRKLRGVVEIALHVGDSTAFWYWIASYKAAIDAREKEKALEAQK